MDGDRWKSSSSVRLPACVTETAAFCVDGIREIPFELDTKKMPINFESTRRFTATYDNIDFNKHVTSYVCALGYYFCLTSS